MFDSFDISGFDELDRQLAKIEDAVQNEIMGAALVEGAETIAEAARADCPVYAGPARDDIVPGALKASIQVSKPKIARGTVAVKVETGEGDYVNGKYFAYFVEFGHRVGARPSRAKNAPPDTRPQVPPHPFMRPAFDAKQAEAEQRIGAAIGKALEKFTV
jgi:HK97 gp10 family phage protein